MALPKISTILPKLLIAGAIAIALAIGAFGIYWVGLQRGRDRADTEISQYEQKISDLNAQLIERQSNITQTVIREYHTREIQRERVVFQNEATIATSVPDGEQLAKGWVHAHNQVAAGEQVDPVLAADSTPSETTSKDALQIIAVNYDIAQATANRLAALQEWVREQEKASEEATVN